MGSQKTKRLSLRSLSCGQWWDKGDMAIPTFAPNQNSACAAHLGLLSLCSDQRVLVMLCHFRKDPLEFSCRNLQGLQGLLSIAFIQGFINQTDGQNP